ncbi:hypothetical protein [Burkholderia ubonensis]|uniref:hypothetical protein n=1 Tax=Burkholderia ubonensis TaxID=101571 RepID=UPI00075E9D43|nr:hypothetical protein [Burkholderia ubonensis]KVN45996.1 hypothetical protein WJ64_25595 [Burkholderia ubonensis]
MALDFSKLPPEKPVPDKPPSRFLWTVVFLVLTLLGVFAVLLLWPAGESTRTPWFWISVTLYPTGFAAFVVSRPYSMYEGRRLNAQAWNAACKQCAELAFARESVPVLILGATIRVTGRDVENEVDEIVDGALVLDAKASDHEENQTTTARWFQPIEAGLAADDPERQAIVLEWLYDRLLADLSESIAALPVELPLRVLLDISGYAGEADAVELWRTKWKSRKLRAADASRAPIALDLMTIDAWLDDENGPLSRRALLFVSVTLSNVIDEPPLDGMSEAGVGLLITSGAVASRFELQAIAALHRPLKSADGNLEHALTYALRWGGVDLGDVGALWISGFDGDSVGPLHASLSHVDQDRKRDDAIPEFNLDRTAGHAGPSSGWLAAACASHQTQQSSTPQLIAQRLEDRTFVAVTTTIDSESKNRRALA